ncbi:T9SS type A sorting domain-containing protein [Hymenobacter roseosalivarius]|uniref:T9SS type A sorting domain-containing protein n=1 Tax=Hymenobacter roseosalivarius TaxID=89967 RepID=UPI0013566961|nr:T9SS type A sorting domain-containing protein [Hymenobacter roseosalivarius]
MHQVDITGESNYSPVRSVQPKAGKYTFQAEVFPNPYEDKVTVQYRSFGAGTTTLTIHDVLGHTLLTKTVAATAGAQEIELPEAASLSAGVYYLTIRQGGQQQVMKLSHR